MNSLAVMCIVLARHNSSCTPRLPHPFLDPVADVGEAHPPVDFEERDDIREVVPRLETGNEAHRVAHFFCATKGAL